MPLKNNHLVYFFFIKKICQAGYFNALLQLSFNKKNKTKQQKKRPKFTLVCMSLLADARLVLIDRENRCKPSRSSQELQDVVQTHLHTLQLIECLVGGHFTCTDYFKGP